MEQSVCCTRLKGISRELNEFNGFCSLNSFNSWLILSVLFLPA